MVHRTHSKILNVIHYLRRIQKRRILFENKVGLYTGFFDTKIELSGCVCLFLNFTLKGVGIEAEERVILLMSIFEKLTVTPRTLFSNRFLLGSVGFSFYIIQTTLQKYHSDSLITIYSTLIR